MTRAATVNSNYVGFILHSAQPPYKEVKRLSVPKEDYSYATTVHDRRQEESIVLSFSVAIMIRFT